MAAGRQMRLQGGDTRDRSKIPFARTVFWNIVAAIGRVSKSFRRNVEMEYTAQPFARRSGLRARRNTMNFEWAKRRTGALAALEFLGVAALATAGSAFGQAKAESAAARLQKIEDRQAI